jgi:hypothetical protein
MRIGQRLQQDTAYNREDNCGSAASEGKREHGNGCESPALPQLPECIAKILTK